MVGSAYISGGVGTGINELELISCFAVCFFALYRCILWVVYDFLRTARFGLHALTCLFVAPLSFCNCCLVVKVLLLSALARRYPVFQAGVRFYLRHPSFSRSAKLGWSGTHSLRRIAMPLAVPPARYYPSDFFAALKSLQDVQQTAYKFEDLLFDNEGSHLTDCILDDLVLYEPPEIVRLVLSCKYFSRRNRSHLILRQGSIRLGSSTDNSLRRRIDLTPLAHRLFCPN
jgi:hypothetical protein